MSKLSEHSLVPVTEELKSHNQRHNLSKVELDLYNEDDDVAEKVIRVKRFRWSGSATLRAVTTSSSIWLLSPSASAACAMPTPTRHVAIAVDRKSAPAFMRNPLIGI